MGRARKAARGISRSRDGRGRLQRARAFLLRFRRAWIFTLDAVAIVWFLAAVNATAHAEPIDRWVALLPPAGVVTLAQLLIFEAGRPYRPSAWRDFGLAVLVYLLAAFPLVANFALLLYFGVFASAPTLALIGVLPTLYVALHALLVFSWHTAGSETLKRFGTKRNISAFQYLLTGLVVLVYMTGSFVQIVDFGLLIVPVFVVVGIALGLVQWRFLEPFVPKPASAQPTAPSEITFRRAG